MEMRIRDVLFGSVFATMVFYNLPFEFPVTPLAFAYPRSPVCYALWLLVIYTIYKNRGSLRGFFVNSNVFGRWLLCYLGVLTVSTIWGLYTFPYGEMFFSPPGQLASSFISRIANVGGFSIDSDSAVTFWVWLRALKGAIISPLFTFGASYLLYCYYYQDFASLKKVFLYGFFCSLAVVIGYSIIDIFYQAGNETAENILKQTYPWFNNLQKEPREWPPPLWPNQLRSIFSEPSRLGNYATIAIPVLLGGTIESASVRAKGGFAFLFFLFTFILFLTQARTVYGLLLGLLFLYAALAFWLKCYRWSVMLVAVLTAASFACASFFMIGFMNRAGYVKRDNVTSIVNSNLISLGDFAEMDNEDNKDKRIRSKARYIMLNSYYKMWLERPVLGVGDFQPLAAAYAKNNLTDKDKEESEIKLWLSIQKNYGILKAVGLRAMNEYADRLGKTGILGLGLYLVPFLYVLYKTLIFLYYVKIGRVKISNNVLCDAFIMSLLICGIIASGMNDNLAAYFGPFAVLGIAYVFLSDVTV